MILGNQAYGLGFCRQIFILTTLAYLMFPYELDRKHSIKDDRPSCNRTFQNSLHSMYIYISQNVMHCSVSLALVFESSCEFCFRQIRLHKDILKLSWLPVEERRGFGCMKLAYKAIHFESWPNINQIEIKSMARILRSSEDLKLLSSMNVLRSNL